MLNPRVGNIVSAPSPVKISDSGLPATDAPLKNLILFMIRLHVPIVLTGFRLEIFTVFHGRQAREEH